MCLPTPPMHGGGGAAGCRCTHELEYLAFACICQRTSVHLNELRDLVGKCDHFSTRRNRSLYGQGPCTQQNSVRAGPKFATRR